MKKILSGLIVLMISLLLNGCAVLLVPGAIEGYKDNMGEPKAAQTYYAKNYLSPEVGKILLYRTDIGGHGKILPVKANGRRYGKLTPNSYMVIAPEGGRNNLTIDIDGNSLKSAREIFIVKPGEIKYVEVDTISLMGKGEVKITEKNQNEIPDKFKYLIKQ